MNDFHKPFLVGDMDVFLGSGPIDVVDKKLSAPFV